MGNIISFDGTVSENDKAFMLEMTHHAKELSLERSVWETLGYEPGQKHLQYALSVLKL